MEIFADSLMKYRRIRGYLFRLCRHVQLKDYGAARWIARHLDGPGALQSSYRPGPGVERESPEDLVPSSWSSVSRRELVLRSSRAWYG